MREVVWSAQAKSQYLSALAFLADRNEPAADKFLKRMAAATEGLARRPLGRPGYVTDTYEKIVQHTSYVIVFELAGDEVRILRLFHMAQDWRGWNAPEAEPQ